MTEAESNKLNKEQQKEKIRERYKGINLDLMEVIPAKKQADFYDDTFRRVAVYVRVSTDNLQQTSSYELQKKTIMRIRYRKTITGRLLISMPMKEYPAPH